MAYTKKLWIARVGTALNRFLKTNEDAGSVELTNDPTGITTAGTPFTVANMNNIEGGIEDNDDRSLANEADNNTQDTAIGLNTTHRGLTNNPHSVDKDDLDLGTTDDVTFGTVNTGQGANELYDMDQNVKTTNSPHWANINPPIDNNDSTLPSIGIGGFTFGISASTTTYPSVTLGASGYWLYVATSTQVTNSYTTTRRVAGGTVISGKYEGTSMLPSTINVIAFRIS